MKRVSPRVWICALGALVSAVPSVLSAQQPASERVRVFLDCDPCDFDFLRREVGFVDYVRDRTVAHVHVLVTRQSTGAGGSEYTIAFLGRGRFRAVDDTLTLVTDRTDTQAERREALASTIALGLVRYVARTPAARNLRVDALAQPSAEGPALPADDPWKGWVFSLSLSGSADGEERQRSSSLRGGLNARQVTSAWKIWVNVNTDLRNVAFEVSDDSTISNTTQNYSVSSQVVMSLGSHFSAGLSGSTNSSTFRNQDVSFGLGPAMEFSFFPYSESSRRSLRAQYRLRGRYYDYTEETIYGKLEETLYEHELELSYNATQPWGEARLSVTWENYLHDFAKRRASLGGFASFRIFRGLNVNFGGNVASVRNQLYLAAGDLSPEEILIRRRQLQTDYEYRTNLGFSYTFGSIYNNVVNPRF